MGAGSPSYCLILQSLIMLHHNSVFFYESKRDEIVLLLFVTYSLRILSDFEQRKDQVC